MRKHLYKLALVVTLGSGLALAQSMPQQQSPNPPAAPQSQQPPASDQTQPSTADQSKVSTANTSDVQNSIQSALQKDPTLASANINVQVSDKDVELSGTVATKDAKATAEQIAKDHSGGLKVKNHLKVSEKGPGEAPKADNPKP